MLLTVGLTDYLENSGAVKDYSDAAGEEPEPEAVYGNTVTPTPIVSVSEGRRAKHRAARAESAAAETKAQQEKRELKEHLARREPALHRLRQLTRRRRTAGPSCCDRWIRRSRSGF